MAAGSRGSWPHCTHMGEKNAGSQLASSYSFNLSSCCGTHSQGVFPPPSGVSGNISTDATRVLIFQVIPNPVRLTVKIRQNMEKHHFRRKPIPSLCLCYFNSKRAIWPYHIWAKHYQTLRSSVSTLSRILTLIVKFSFPGPISSAYSQRIDYLVSCMESSLWLDSAPYHSGWLY